MNQVSASASRAVSSRSNASNKNIVNKDITDDEKHKKIEIFDARTGKYVTRTNHTGKGPNLKGDSTQTGHIPKKGSNRREELSKGSSPFASSSRNGPFPLQPHTVPPPPSSSSSWSIDNHAISLSRNNNIKQKATSLPSSWAPPMGFPPSPSSIVEDTQLPVRERRAAGVNPGPIRDGVKFSPIGDENLSGGTKGNTYLEEDTADEDAYDDDETADDAEKDAYHDGEEDGGYYAEGARGERRGRGEGNIDNSQNDRYDDEYLKEASSGEVDVEYIHMVGNDAEDMDEYEGDVEQGVYERVRGGLQGGHRDGHEDHEEEEEEEGDRNEYGVEEGDGESIRWIDGAPYSVPRSSQKKSFTPTGLSVGSRPHTIATPVTASTVVVNYQLSSTVDISGSGSSADTAPLAGNSMGEGAVTSSSDTDKRVGITGRSKKGTGITGSADTEEGVAGIGSSDTGLVVGVEERREVNT